MNGELNLMSVTTILTDLSDVLIGGMIGLDDIISNKYGECFGNEFSIRFASTYSVFNDLMRGRISEEEYWECLYLDSLWSGILSIADMKNLFALNMKKIIPGTLDLYNRLILPNGYSPKYYIVSDHIKEYREHITNWHHDLFNLADKVYWSYDCGRIKRDDDFFTIFFQDNSISSYNAIFIDDSKQNIDNANKSNILSIYFSSSEALKEDLLKLGFSFTP